MNNDQRTARMSQHNVAEALLDGNRRFVEGRAQAHTWQSERIASTGTVGQFPSVGVLGCADSRVPPEQVFDCGVGDLVVVRVAGNSVTEIAVGTMEFGVSALGVHTIVVLGHTKCAAVEAALRDEHLPGSMNAFARVIRPALAGHFHASLTDAVVANVRHQAGQLLARSDLLQRAVQTGRVRMLTALYDVETGLARFLD